MTYHRKRIFEGQHRERFLFSLSFCFDKRDDVAILWEIPLLLLLQPMQIKPTNFDLLNSGVGIILIDVLMSLTNMKYSPYTPIPLYLLEVNIFAFSHSQSVRHKVIFCCWEDLYNVSSFSSDIHVMDYFSLKVCWTTSYREGMGPDKINIQKRFRAKFLEVKYYNPSSLKYIWIWLTGQFHYINVF